MSAERVDLYNQGVKDCISVFEKRLKFYKEGERNYAWQSDCTSYDNVYTKAIIQINKDIEELKKLLKD